MCPYVALPTHPRSCCELEEKWTSRRSVRQAKATKSGPARTWGQPLVVMGQSAAASGPGEVAFKDPAFGQEHEAAFGLGQADDLQLEAVRGGVLGHLLAGVALVNEGHLNVRAGPGRRDNQRQQVPSVLTAAWTLKPLRRLCPL